MPHKLPKSKANRKRAFDDQDRIQFPDEIIFKMELLQAEVERTLLGDGSIEFNLGLTDLQCRALLAGQVS